MHKSEHNRNRKLERFDVKADDSLWIAEDEYVDWNKRGRVDQRTTPSGKSKLMAFGIPFLVVFIAILAISSFTGRKKITPNKPQKNPPVAAKAENRHAPKDAPSEALAEAKPDEPAPPQIPVSDLDKALEDALADAPLQGAEPLVEETVADADADLPVLESADPVADSRPDLTDGDFNVEPDALLVDDDDLQLSTPDADDVDALLVDALDSIAGGPADSAPILSDDSPLELAADLPDSDPAADAVDPALDDADDALALSDDDDFGDLLDAGDESLDLAHFGDEHAEPAVDIDALRAELAQLEFAFQQTKEENADDANALLGALDAPLNAVSAFVENAPEELADDANALLTRILALQAILRDGADFFMALRELDDASINPEATREFFRARPVVDASLDDPIFLQYDADLKRVADVLDALQLVDDWNAFMQENGERLERFHAAKEDAAMGLAFIGATLGKPGAPEEAAVLAKRKAQWSFDAANDFPTQRKIVLMLESELRQQYWTYSPERNKIYYLPEAPKAGANRFVASAKGTVGTITIPADAPELAAEISPQKKALSDLAKLAWDIPDSLRNDDVALWYAKWAQFLRVIQESNDLDPILQYKYFKETALYLKASDYYFAAQLDPLLRVLNAPKLDEKNSIDRFQTESQDIVALRDLALSRLSFLPKDHLNVNKTTEELNAKAPRFATLYNRVGWLDKSFNDKWILRRPADAEIPNGDLYVLYVDSDADAPKWFKIGSADGKLITLNVASESIPRGSIVLCRVPMNAGTAVAARSAVDALFKR